MYWALNDFCVLTYSNSICKTCSNFYPVIYFSPVRFFILA